MFFLCVCVYVKAKESKTKRRRESEKWKDANPDGKGQHISPIDIVPSTRLLQNWKKKGKRCGLLFPCNTNNNKKKKKAATRHRREHTLHAKALYGWQIKKDHLFATKSEFSSAAVYQTSWGKSWRKQALWSYLEPDILFWISVHFFFFGCQSIGVFLAVAWSDSFLVLSVFIVFLLETSSLQTRCVGVPSGTCAHVMRGTD